MCSCVILFGCHVNGFVEESKMVDFVILSRYCFWAKSGVKLDVYTLLDETRIPMTIEIY